MGTPVRTYSKRRFAASIYTNTSSDSPEDCLSSQDSLIGDLLDPFSHRVLHDSQNSIGEEDELQYSETSSKTSDIFSDVDALPINRSKKTVVVKRRKVVKEDVVKNDFDVINASKDKDNYRFDNILDDLFF